MRDMSATMAKMSGQHWNYAEGCIRHNCLGFSSQNRDILKEVLQDKVVVNQEHEK